MASEFPAQLNDGQVLAYIDDTANNETKRLVEAYLSDHPDFAQEIQQMSHLQETLIGALNRATSPSSLELGEYLLGLLPTARASEVEQAIATHPAIARETAALEAYWTMLTPDLDPPPESRGSMVSQAAGQVDILIAKLVNSLSGHLTGGPTPALAGVRGTRGEQQEQLTFEAGDAQIIVEIEEDTVHPEQRMILGLVIGLDAPKTFDAHLYCDGTLLQTVAVDELGNFIIPNISPALHELILSSGQSPTEIHIQHVPI